ncbi:sulfite exporter TauE/SafE family protein [Roseibium sp.]|uniref:sulfite exporter TauE/SafE family protein n=1 Tax=Roseibium sp. TaxID=1936156 RepID=UPI003A9832B6
MSLDFLTFFLVGFLAQIVDGALGMAYGVTSTSVLLSLGVTPASASAAIHVAELFTTGASGLSHLAFKNIDRRLVLTLAPAGVIGALIGAFVLTSFPGDTIRPFIIAYLAIMGLVVLSRVHRFPEPRRLGRRALAPLGFTGGFLDAAGGGGWGPVVTSSLLGAGEEPRYVVGSVNAAEFFVTLAASFTFVVALASGHWVRPEGAVDLGWAVAGLIVGGLLAAPFAGLIIRFVPRKVLGTFVGVLIIGLSIFQAVSLLG